MPKRISLEDKRAQVDREINRLMFEFNTWYECQIAKTIAENRRCRANNKPLKRAAW